MSQGWIKLHRQIEKWEWYKDVNAFKLFIHLLLNANHKDGRWQGIEIKRGQLITGRKKLSDQTGLSEGQIKRQLARLKATNELTSKTTNKYSLLTIVNYDSYNDKDSPSDQQNDQQRDNKRPTNDQQTTTNKNVKKEKNEEEVTIDVELEQFYEDFFEVYPRRNKRHSGKDRAKRKLKAIAVKNRASVIQAAKHYNDSKDAKGNYAKDPSTFFSDDFWKEWVEAEESEEEEKPGRKVHY
jgi:hypothetical protein